MGKVTVYCVARTKISGCTPEIASSMLDEKSEHSFVVGSAFENLADAHELASQDDLCVIGPIKPSGRSYWEPHLDGNDEPISELPENAICVVPHCRMGDSWDFGFVDGPPPNEQADCYLISYGCCLMVQTHALDIMAIATHGRMTPLRLWRLAMRQGHMRSGLSDCFRGVNYGEMTDRWEQVPELFPGFSSTQLEKLEDIGDVEIVKERLVHEGKFWIWMAPDRFPVSPVQREFVTLAAPELPPSEDRSTIESLPPEMLDLIVSRIPLRSLLNLASASRWLRKGILENDHLACIWIYRHAPWWIPVRTHTPRNIVQILGQITASRTYLASEWTADMPLALDFPVGLDWAYVRRCARSGSMRNRRRIWNTALDVERVADLAGV